MGFAMRNRLENISGTPVSVGIDIGTRNARVAAWQDGDVVVIPNDRGRLATPAVVAFTDNGVLVGEAAEDQAEGNLENTIFAPTRLIGSKFHSPWVHWYQSTWPSRIVRGDGDRPLLRVTEKGKERLLRPEEVVTVLVEYLRRAAERYLSARVTEAVVTIPAQYGPQQCAALVQAVQDARLTVLQLVKAPTAAGIAFCQMNPCTGRQTLLVSDMGGSYFDFCLLTVEDSLIFERAVGTDYVDLDATLLRFALRDLRDRFAVDISDKQAAIHRLRQACESARRKLHQFHQAWIEVKDIIDGVDYSAGISRAHFEDCCHADMETLLDPVDFCLEDCGLSRAEVDVVLVGGNARVPQVRRLVRAFFYGRSPHEVLRPDHAAVLGAAVWAALLSEHTAGSNASASDGAADHSPGTPGPPLPRPLRLRQAEAAPCRAEPPFVEEPALEPAGPGGGDAALTREGEIGGWPSRRSSDLEPPPCNEATRCPSPVNDYVPRPASALRTSSASRPSRNAGAAWFSRKCGRQASGEDAQDCNLWL